ncbi:Early nodulin-like protein 2 [Linum grandiflorum]
MTNLTTPKFLALCAFQLLALLHIQVSCYQYKVGDLDAWGIPTDSNPKVYIYWAKYHNLTVGDSLLFLYPPSQDSVIQVTPQNFDSCNLKNPILYMNNGNSLFNITQEGVFYFTSGEPGRCEKKQKIRITVGNVSATAYPPSSGEALADSSSAPTSPIAFGSIPTSSSSSSLESRFSVLLSVVVGSLVSGIIRGAFM